MAREDELRQALETITILHGDNRALDDACSHFAGLFREADRLTDEQRDLISRLYLVLSFWYRRCANLTEFANRMVVDILELLKKADNTIIIAKTPFDVLNLIDTCKLMLSEFKKDTIMIEKSKRHPR